MFTTWGVLSPHLQKFEIFPSLSGIYFDFISILLPRWTCIPCSFFFLISVTTWFIIFLLIFIGVELLYSVVFISTVQKSESAIQFSSVQLLSHVQLFATPWIAACQASLSITNSRVHSDSRPSSQWCHPAISSSVVPFSFCPQSLPASECFPMSQLFTWGAQSTGVSASVSVLQMNTRTDL